jgi:hypothetical protein
VAVPRRRARVEGGAALRLVHVGRLRVSALARWHLLSLDAPTVATVWTWFVARAMGVRLSWTAPAAMFVAVWMLYAADRLLDARGAAVEELEERHRFHHRHRGRFLAATPAAAIALAVLLQRQADAALHLYVLLAALLGGWLLLVHARLRQPRLPKELAVGVFFPAATFIPTVAVHPEMRLELLAPALLFAAVCLLNCLLLYAWEHPVDRTRAHATTRWAMGRLWAMGCCVVIAAVGLGLAERPVAAIAAACGMAAAGLLGLHAVRHRVSRLEMRALADVPLLAPVLVLPFLLLSKLLLSKLLLSKLR